MMIEDDEDDDRYEDDELRYSDERVNVIFELILRDMLLPDNTAMELVKSQSKEMKLTMIKQHVLLRTSNGQEKRIKPTIMYTGSMELYSVELENLERTLRTVDRGDIKYFFENSGRIFFEMLMYHVSLFSKTHDETMMIKKSLACLKRLADNREGLRRILEFPNALVTIALVIDTHPVVAVNEGDVDSKEVYILSIQNTIVALKLLTQLAWGKLGGGASKLLDAMTRVRKIRRTIGGPLFLISCIRCFAPQPKMLEMFAAIMNFLNSIIELEDDIIRRKCIREEVIDYGLIDRMSDFVERSIWETKDEERTRGTLRTQLDVFQHRMEQDDRQETNRPPYPAKSYLKRMDSSWKQVASFLNNLELGDYVLAFSQLGYDTMDRVTAMDAHDFSKVGMRHGHILAFQRGLKEFQNSTSTLLSDSRSKPYAFKIIPKAALVIKGLIGRGNFGDVHLAEYQGGRCVVKKIRKHATNAKSDGDNSLTGKVIMQEAAAMNICKDHPHVIGFFGICLDATDALLVTEYAELGSLYDVIVVGKPNITLQYVLNVARQGVSGLVHLHSLNVLHRDIASRNFLMDSRGIVKVCDFGLARVKGNPTRESSASNRVDNPLKWAAPESLALNEFSTASDVYMTGVFLWELWAQNVPYVGMNNIEAAFKVVHEHLRPEISDKMLAESPQLVSLVSRCWGPDPLERPHMMEVLEEVTRIGVLNSSKTFGSEDGIYYDDFNTSIPTRT